jgi:hypothetical protein
MQLIVIIMPWTKYNCSWKDDYVNYKWPQFSLREVSVCQLPCIQVVEVLLDSIWLMNLVAVSEAT